LGIVKKDEMILNQFGEIMKKVWVELPKHYGNCVLENFVVMPNHFHGIVEIRNELKLKLHQTLESSLPSPLLGTGFKPVRTNGRNLVVPINHGLSEIIRGFKTFSSCKINDYNGGKISEWQRSF
jgi:putative transposase